MTWWNVVWEGERSEDSGGGLRGWIASVVSCGVRWGEGVVVREMEGGSPQALVLVTEGCLCLSLRWEQEEGQACGRKDDMTTLMCQG